MHATLASRNYERLQMTFLVIVIALSSFLTYSVWRNRPTLKALNRWYENSPHSQSAWSALSQAYPWSEFSFRDPSTFFWTYSHRQLISNGREVASGFGPVILKRDSVQIQLAPTSNLTLGNERIVWKHGSGEFKSSGSELTIEFPPETGLEPIQAKSGWIVFDGQSFKFDRNGYFTLPKPGAILVLDELEGAESHTGFSQIQFKADVKWESQGTAILEISDTPQFSNIVHSQNLEKSPTGFLSTASVSFGERGPGYYYARLRDSKQSEIKVATYFRVLKSRNPSRIRALGKRYLSFEDDSDATTYRIEFSKSESFTSITQSHDTTSHLIDLYGVNQGTQFVRVVSVWPDGSEYKSAALALVVPPSDVLLKAQVELSDPRLEMLARAWKILLSPEESTRLRDGYVILRESEIKGIRPKETLLPTEFAFELSRDPSFSNPERVRPDRRGELLPPALPLGTLFARIRAIESDGALGAVGPVSRLTTLLPAPTINAPVPTKVDGKDGFELSWTSPIEVAGYELRTGPDPSVQTVTRTTQPKAKLATSFQDVETESNRGVLFYTVQALNADGNPVSVRSELKQLVLIDTETPLKLSMVNPASIKPRTQTSPSHLKRSPASLMEPADQSVIVGGASSTRYGKLKWAGELKPSEKFEVQISTDNDFVNIIARGSTRQNEFQLQGDLPEGSLFWRVKRNTDREWTSSRRFDLVYE